MSRRTPRRDDTQLQEAARGRCRQHPPEGLECPTRTRRVVPVGSREDHTRRLIHGGRANCWSCFGCWSPRCSRRQRTRGRRFQTRSRPSFWVLSAAGAPILKSHQHSKEHKPSCSSHSSDTEDTGLTSPQHLSRPGSVITYIVLFVLLWFAFGWPQGARTTSRCGSRTRLGALVYGSLREYMGMIVQKRTYAYCTAPHVPH